MNDPIIVDFHADEMRQLVAFLLELKKYQVTIEVNREDGDWHVFIFV